MLTEILEHTPHWVWAMLAALLALGWMQTRPRAVRAWQLATLPLALAGLGLGSLIPALPQVPWAIAAWALSMALAMRVGRRWLQPVGARWDAQAQRMHLPGSWLPMLLLAIIFPLKYGVGVYTALFPVQALAPGFVSTAAIVSGLLGGLLAGRAWALVAMAGQRATPTTGGRVAAAASWQPHAGAWPTTGTGACSQRPTQGAGSRRSADADARSAAHLPARRCRRLGSRASSAAASRQAIGGPKRSGAAAAAASAAASASSTKQCASCCGHTASRRRRGWPAPGAGSRPRAAGGGHRPGPVHPRASGLRAAGRAARWWRSEPESFSGMPEQRVKGHPI